MFLREINKDNFYYSIFIHKLIWYAIVLYFLFYVSFYYQMSHNDYTRLRQLPSIAIVLYAFRKQDSYNNNNIIIVICFITTSAAINIKYINIIISLRNVFNVFNFSSKYFKTFFILRRITETSSKITFTIRSKYIFNNFILCFTFKDLETVHDL